MELFRIVFHDDPTARVWATFPAGRYHDAGSPGRTGYWCPSIESAWREILAHNPDADPAKFVVLRARLECREVLSLADPAARAAFGVTREELVSPTYEATQQIGLLVRERGFAAMETYSFADQPDGRVVVVFEECLARSKSKLEILDMAPLTQARPELRE